MWGGREVQIIKKVYERERGGPQNLGAHKYFVGIFEIYVGPGPQIFRNICRGGPQIFRNICRGAHNILGAHKYFVTPALKNELVKYI